MKRIILSVFLIFASSCLTADPVQSLDLLKDKIEAHVLNEVANYSEGSVKVKADKIDPRLNLRLCADDKLEVFNPYQTAMLNTNTMGIKCLEETNHWTLYVPIKITILKNVFVAKHALLKGNRVGDDDIYQTQMDTQRLKQGYFTDSHDIVGLVCKHDTPADFPLNPYNIELPKLVHRDEQVTIVASIDNLKVSMNGIALKEGVKGDTIKVKNLSSHRVIEALVTGEKKVKVIL